MHYMYKYTDLIRCLCILLGPLHRHDIGLQITGHAHHIVQSESHLDEIQTASRVIHVYSI